LNTSFEYVASLWLCNKRHLTTDTINAAALWAIWNTRNDLCFNQTPWAGMQMIDLEENSMYAILVAGPEDAKEKMIMAQRTMGQLTRIPPRLL
jgi:hypothetical protein